MAKIGEESAKDKARRKLSLQKKYGQRITIARQAREAFQAKDYVGAIKKYNEYLSILSEINNADDIYKITPKMFDPKKDITEMLLISHVYWELARTYEKMPKLEITFHKALNQFVKFTVNQPYQVFNAEMLRKYIKKYKFSDQSRALNEAYAQIYVQSKKCFIASDCFGGDHWVTNNLRSFKNLIVKYRFGIEFTHFYYKYSPFLIDSLNSNIFTKCLKISVIKPFLIFMALLSRGLCTFSQKS